MDKPKTTLEKVYASLEGIPYSYREAVLAQRLVDEMEALEALRLDYDELAREAHRLREAAVRAEREAEPAFNDEAPFNPNL